MIADGGLDLIVAGRAVEVGIILGVCVVEVASVHAASSARGEAAAAGKRTLAARAPAALHGAARVLLPILLLAKLIVHGLLDHRGSALQVRCPPLEQVGLCTGHSHTRRTTTARGSPLGFDAVLRPWQLNLDAALALRRRQLAERLERRHVRRRGCMRSGSTLH